MGSKKKINQQLQAKKTSNRGPVGKGRSKTLPPRDVARSMDLDEYLDTFLDTRCLRCGRAIQFVGAMHPCEKPKER